MRFSSHNIFSDQRLDKGSSNLPIWVLAQIHREFKIHDCISPEDSGGWGLLTTKRHTSAFGLGLSSIVHPGIEERNTSKQKQKAFHSVKSFVSMEVNTINQLDFYQLQSSSE